MAQGRTYVGGPRRASRGGTGAGFAAGMAERGLDERDERRLDVGALDHYALRAYARHQSLWYG